MKEDKICFIKESAHEKILEIMSLQTFWNDQIVQRPSQVRSTVVKFPKIIQLIQVTTVKGFKMIDKVQLSGTRLKFY